MVETEEEQERCRRCGHARALHEHYRSGSDCSICGPEVCPGFRSRQWWWLPRRGRRA